MILFCLAVGTSVCGAADVRAENVLHQVCPDECASDLGGLTGEELFKQFKECVTSKEDNSGLWRKIGQNCSETLPLLLRFDEIGYVGRMHEVFEAYYQASECVSQLEDLEKKRECEAVVDFLNKALQKGLEDMIDALRRANAKSLPPFNNQGICDE
jgi:hypothetical protein